MSNERAWDPRSAIDRELGFGIKPPTATQIDKACQAGFIVLYGEREVMGAVAHRKAEVTIQGRLWVQMQDDHSWHYVSAPLIVITETKSRKKKRRTNMPAGKREPGRPSHLQLATKKGGAQSSAKKETEAKAAAAEAEPVKTEQSPPTKERKPRLPGMEDKESRIPALDVIGEKLILIDEDEKVLKKRRKRLEVEAQAALKKHKRDYYRYGTIELWREDGKPKIKARRVEEKETGKATKKKRK